MECEGARKRSKTWLRGSPKRIEETKTLQKLGFGDVSKSVGKNVISPFWRAAHDPKREKMVIFDSLRAPSQLFVFCFFLGFWRSGRGAEIAKTLRFCGFRSWSRFWAALFFVKKTGLRKCGKKFASKKKRCAIYVFEPYFGPFLAHRFWGWVFLRCGARLNSYNARKMPLSDLFERYQNRPLHFFWCVLFAVPRILGRKNPLSLRCRESFGGTDATRRKIRPRRQKPHGNCGKKRFLAWGMYQA